MPVDFELRGCPINKHQLFEVISAFLAGRQPQTPPHSVCVECKRRGIVCVMVAHGVPCLGPVTQAGCGALCPGYDRGCYGCYGPKETPAYPFARRVDERMSCTRRTPTWCAPSGASTPGRKPFRKRSVDA